MSHGADTPYGTVRRVDPVRIWAGGVATAIVAGGVALVGFLVIRSLYRVLGSERLGSQDYAIDQVTLAVLATSVALLATGLLHLLMVSTPRAPTFFAWIMALVVVAAVVQELVGGGSWLSNVLFSALYLIIGLAIGSLLTGVGRTAVKYYPAARATPAQDQDPRYRDDARYQEDPRYPDDRAYRARQDRDLYGSADPSAADDQTRRLPPYPDR